MSSILEFDEFRNKCFQKCKEEVWFPALLEDCYSLDTSDITISSVVGSIHEGLRINYDEALEFFWTVFLINPLIAIKAYQETELLLGKIDIYRTFKHVLPALNIYGYLANSQGVYNKSVKCYLIFCIEAMLQKEIKPDTVLTPSDYFLNYMYKHDKKINYYKSQNTDNNVQLEPKWLNHKSLDHILNAIDPHHIIILLLFFARKYGARLRKGGVAEYCFSADKYNYIIRFIKNKYGSLSEYIVWDDAEYRELYLEYYKTSLCYDEIFRNMNVIFPTKEDKTRIERLSGVEISDSKFESIRSNNRLLNPDSNLVKLNEEAAPVPKRGSGARSKRRENDV